MSEDSKTPPENLLPAVLEAKPRSALEIKYVKNILAADPGIGEKSLAIANSLADSGLSGPMAAMIIQAVYAPTTVDGRGQGTRIKWYVDAVRNRYGHKLDKIRTNVLSFRTFMADMEEVSQMRDELNGNGYSVSFEGAFLLWEIGEDVDSIQTAIEAHLDHLRDYPGSCMKRVVEAAMEVKSGKRFVELETALQFMNQREMIPDENYGEHTDRPDRPEDW
jgi:hypothetical protein